MNRTKLLELANAIQALNENKKYNLIDYIYPDKGPFSRQYYPKHVQFMDAGSKHRFRLLSGGNGSGKSFTGATEISYHLSGEYPHWWKGHKFKKAIKAWVIAESGALWRDSMQGVLMGSQGEETGTGLIKKEWVSGTPKSMPGIPGALGQILVKHKSGGVSSLTVKTFEMGREQFQAATLDLIVFDEEPPEHVYSECIARLRGVKGKKDPGISILLFTPLKGLTEVVMRYLPNGQFPIDGIHPEVPERYSIAVSWDDAPHLSDEDKRTMLAEYSPAERDARSKGLPALGSGRVYPIMEDDIVCEPFRIPEYFSRAYGLDFGWNNTAVIWGAKDPSTGVLYIYAEYKKGKLTDYQHAYAIQQRGAWISGAADPSGGGRRDDGKMRIDYFRSLGLDLHPGDNSIIQGLSTVFGMLEAGTLKFFSNLNMLLSEFRVYRYDPKDPNKIARGQDDHLLDALRYLISRFDMISVSEYDTEMRDMDPYDSYVKEHDVDPLTGY